MSKVVAVYSGGLDSTVMLHAVRGFDEVVAVSFDYGQRHAKEVDYAYKNCARLGIRHFLVALKLPYSDVPLMGEGDIPDGYYTDESMKKTIVPSRNATFLSIAWGVAISLNADAVAFAAHSGDHPIYPDCRPGFVSAMETALRIGSESKMTLLTPFIGMDKTAIVKLGNKLGVAFSDTWSCYKGGEVHCGKCGTCTERIEAFQLAGLTDPTTYEEEL